MRPSAEPDAIASQCGRAPARAHRAVALDREVADLGREAVRAAHDTAVEHDRAADSGAEGDEQRVARAGRGTEPHLTPARDVGIVVDDDG